MKNFQHGNTFGGKNFGQRTMHKATCSTCGKPCEVPFRPSGNRPIFCNDCFGKSGNAPHGNRPHENHFAKPRFEDRRPDERRTFDARDARPAHENNNAEQFKKQFELLHEKLDNISRMIASAAPAAPTKTAPKKIVTKKGAAKKSAKAKK